MSFCPGSPFCPSMCSHAQIPQIGLTPFTSFYFISTLIPKLHSFLLSFCIKLPKTLSYHSIQICSPAYLNTQTHLISHYCIALYNFFSYKLHYFSTSLKFPIANYQQPVSFPEPQLPTSFHRQSDSYFAFQLCPSAP